MATGAGYGAKSTKTLVLLAVAAILDKGHCAGKSYQVLLERADITCDHNYVINCTAAITRPNRTSPFVFNMRAIIHHNWLNNVTVGFKGYELKGTQYKESIVNFEKTVCNMLNEKWIFPTVQPYSSFPLKCPVKAGHQYIKDMFVDMTHFPAIFPLAKWKLNVLFMLSKSRHVMGELNVYVNIVSVKNKIVKKKV